MIEFCCLCKKKLHDFMTTPILEDESGEQHQICEECADKEFPGWDRDELD